MQRWVLAIIMMQTCLTLFSHLPKLSKLQFFQPTSMFCTFSHLYLCLYLYLYFLICDMTPPSGLLSTIFTFISGPTNAATQYRVWHHHPPHSHHLHCWNRMNDEIFQNYFSKWFNWFVRNKLNGNLSINPDFGVEVSCGWDNRFLSNLLLKQNLRRDGS